MKFGDSISVAIESLVANKLRACLTMLGIIIGVGAVIALMAIGQGSQKSVQDKIAGLGSNLLFITPGSTSSGGLSGGLGSARTLSLDDATSLPGNVTGVVDAVAEVQVPSQVSGTGTNTFAQVTGVSADYSSVLNFQMAEGEFFSSYDVDSSNAVAVIGSNMAKTLFGDTDALGQKIRVGLGRNNFIELNVVGVLQSVGGNSTTSQDNLIYTPITVAQKRLASNVGAKNASLVSKITVQVENKGDIGAAKKGITDLLVSRHGSEDFLVNSQDDIAAAANAVNRTMTMLLGVVAGISLLVGGIGIMNIMLVSVTERTREIGIRKAVGARKADILMQFLTEAVTVTTMGGLLGVIAGVGSAELLNGQSISGIGDNIQTVISWTSVFAAMVVSGGIGIFFGLYPANRAAGLKPIDALHYE